MDYKWEAFNVGINNGEAAGQSVMWPHVHMIPRRKGDTPHPKGGVRHVIPYKGNYEDLRIDHGVDIIGDEWDEQVDSWTMTTAKAITKGITAKEISS